MARSIVGTLVEIGLKRLTLERFVEIFESKKRSKEIVTAPAQGLVLDKVFYDHNQWHKVVS